jgi:hypothetical protein
MNPPIEIAFAEHVCDLLKFGFGAPMVQPQPLKPPAEPGHNEKYMPWYTAAGIGAIGHSLGSVMSPPKYKMLGGAAGAVAGTVLGVHGGEMLGRHMDKQAGEEPGPPDYNKTLRRIAMRQAGTTAKEIGAIALPMAAGMGTGFGIQKYLEHTGHSAAPMAKKVLGLSALPVAGLTAGALYRAAQQLKNQEFDRIRQEEMNNYETALQAHRQNLKRTPQPEGL